MSKLPHPIIVTNPPKRTIDLSSAPVLKETKSEGIETVVKFRRNIQRFKSPLEENEIVKLNSFVQSFQNDHINIRILNETETKDLSEKEFTPRFTAVMLSSSIYCPIECIDLLNRIELFCTSNEWFGYWDNRVATKYKQLNKLETTYCLCIGHPTQRFIRFAPRPSPTIYFN